MTYLQPSRPWCRPPLLEGLRDSFDDSFFPFPNNFKRYSTFSTDQKAGRVFDLDKSVAFLTIRTNHSLAPSRFVVFVVFDVLNTIWPSLITHQSPRLPLKEIPSRIFLDPLPFPFGTRRPFEVCAFVDLDDDLDSFDFWFLPKRVDFPEHFIFCFTPPSDFS
jgi:hypothetical protein